MKSNFVFLIAILLFCQCKQKEEYVQMPPHQKRSPNSLLHQHESLLTKAALLPANGDSSAVNLRELLEYHFSEEEQYVFPVLNILPVLASGKMPEDSVIIAGLVKRFKSNSAKLLAEHQMIMKLMQELRAKFSGDTSLPELEAALSQHARLEEEILFPAAVVAGDYLEVLGRK